MEWYLSTYPITHSHVQCVYYMLCIESGNCTDNFQCMFMCMNILLYSVCTYNVCWAGVCGQHCQSSLVSTGSAIICLGRSFFPLALSTRYNFGKRNPTLLPTPTHKHTHTHTSWLFHRVCHPS